MVEKKGVVRARFEPAKGEDGWATEKGAETPFRRRSQKPAPFTKTGEDVAPGDGLRGRVTLGEKARRQDCLRYEKIGKRDGWF